MNICTFIRTALTVLAATSLLNANGQTETPKFTDPPQVIPPSPVASSLLRDVNVPVNAYSGAISFSLPLHTVKCGSISLPITLTYSSHGVPVEADAGPVGLDWQLEAGGVIGRSVVGLPDEIDNQAYSDDDGRGYKSVANRLGMPLPDFKNNDAFAKWYGNNFLNLTDNNVTEWMQLCRPNANLHYEHHELTPDIYFMNFCGHSARLFFDHKGNYYISPYKAWKIEGDINNGFIVTTEDGTRYEFKKIEHSYFGRTTYETPNCDFTGYDREINYGGASYISAWYLTSIISPEKTDTIRLTYNGFNIGQFNTKTGSQQKSFSYRFQEMKTVFFTQYMVEPIVSDQLPNEMSSLSNSSSGGETFLVSTISTKNEKVIFYMANNRLDGNPGGLSTKIDSMAVYRTIAGNENQPVSTYNLNYGYFNSESSKPLSSYLTKRLKLNSVTESASGMPNQTYSFSYNTDLPLPPKNSLAQDYWGYYNGKTGNPTLISAVETEDLNAIQCPEFGDRSVDTAYVKSGLLNRITYPTGGYTSLEYEANSFSSYTGDLNQIPDVLNRKYAWVNITATSEGEAVSAKFTITAEQVITFDYYFQNQTEPDDGGMWAGTSWFNLSNDKGVRIDLTSPSLNYSPKINLPPGNYTLTANTMRGYDANIKFRYYTLPPRHNIHYAGGARLKTVVQNTGDAGKQVVKRYIYEFNDSLSSGHLLNTPYWSEDAYFPLYGQFELLFYEKYSDVKYLNCQSQSLISLGRTQGNIIGYDKVKTVYGENGEGGYEINTYSFFDDLWYGFPYAPTSSFEDLRGLPLSKKIFDRNGKLVSSTVNSYNYNNENGNPNFKWINGVKIGVSHFADREGIPVKAWMAVQISPIGYGYVWKFEHQSFRHYQFWPTLASTTNVQYLPKGRDSLVTKDVFTYNTVNGLVSSKKSVTSRGDTLLNVYKYPLDFKGTAVYDSMVARNIVSPVVQQLSYRGSSFLEKATTHYGFQNDNMILPAKINLQTGTAADEERLTFNSYDQWGNPEEFQKSDRVKTTYLWGYNGAYPVAQVVGAGKAAVWDAMARAGITQANLDNAAKYSDAEFIELLKKLRLQLPSTQVSLFTYKPLVGMTSATDPRGETTYYSYDKFGRLLNVKNKYQLVLNELRYHYFNEPEQ